MHSWNWMLAGLIFSLMGCSAPKNALADDAWKPSASLVAAIESQLSMPSKSRSKETYVRYFAGIMIEGRWFVVGVFLYDPANAAVRLVDISNLPEVHDGGCDVVNLRYDVEREEVVSIFCNGEA